MDPVGFTEPTLGLSQIPGMDTGMNDTQMCEGSDEEASGAVADTVKVVSDAERGARQTLPTNPRTISVFLLS